MSAPTLNTPEQSIEALLQLHDERFVAGAYALILGRDPDAGGMRSYLGHLRAGMHKTQIINELAESSEGKEKAAVNAEFLDLVRKRNSQSVWSRLFRRFSGGTADETERQLRIIINHMYVIEEAVRKQSVQVAELHSLLNKGVNSATNTRQKAALGNTGSPNLSGQSPKLSGIFVGLQAAILAKKRV
jgi:hypothetical protein